MVTKIPPLVANIHFFQDPSLHIEGKQKGAISVEKFAEQESRQAVYADDFDWWRRPRRSKPALEPSLMTATSNDSLGYERVVAVDLACHRLDPRNSVVDAASSARCSF